MGPGSPTGSPEPRPPRPGSPVPAAAGPARFRRWLGWGRHCATIAIGLDDDVATVLCLRRSSVITASGRSTLPPGTIRRGGLRVAGPAIDALTRIRTDLDLPARSEVVALIEPRSAAVARSSVVAQVDADEVAAVTQAIQAAGFAAPMFDPVPAALARLASVTAPPDGARYAEGAGWRTYQDRDHLELERSDRHLSELVVGPTPAERSPLTGPAPIGIDRGVTLSRGWSLLLGAALAPTGLGPASHTDEVSPVAAGAWTIERIPETGADR